MTFASNLSNELKETIKKLYSKDKKLFLELQKKINLIISCDKETINHYKNLRYGLSDYKRVHVGKSIVLLFSVDVQNNTVYFVKFDHHDKIYK
ncbi:MAG TPA: addiction module toxin RelE [archaeon]|jgi:YafQ family addiction module toxin component|nr:addiction module toxin RelE [archaeon]HPV66210.1 addiction module toxin RelE [archaeon]